MREKGGYQNVGSVFTNILMSFCLFGSEHKGLNLKKYGHLDGKMMRKPWHFGEGAPDPPSHTGAQGGARG